MAEIAQHLVGRSPLDIAELHTVAGGIYGLTQAIDLANQIVGPLEMAMWDIAGKWLGLPVHRLFGGACRDAVDYFAFVHGRDSDELCEDAGRLAAGYPVIYLKVGRGEAPTWRTSPPCAAHRRP